MQGLTPVYSELLISLSSYTTSISDPCWDKHTGLEELICSLCSRGQFIQTLKRQTGRSYEHPSFWQRTVRQDSSVLTLLTFNLNMWGVWPPSLFTKLTVLGIIWLVFYCGILWHRICTIIWSWDMLTYDALPNPLADSGKGVQKICFYKVPNSVGNFYFVRQQLSCCCWSTLQFHSS